MSIAKSHNYESAMKGFLDYLDARISLKGKRADFLLSSLTEENPFNDTDTFLERFQEKEKQLFEVKKIPLDEIANWYFDEATGNLRHATGKFFSIEAISVETNIGNVRQWTQPIINQPEIGILGILTKKFNGILYFLMQAKMEPGNINNVQLSPTVQATKSNYTRVHQGKETNYLEYFIDKSRSRVLLDQLQSEQGGRFLRKRNRNIIVEVTGDEEIAVKDDYYWLTLGQIKKLLKQNNIVNMDSRTVISSINYHCDRNAPVEVNKLTDMLAASSLITDSISSFHLDLLLSALKIDRGLHSMDDIRSWFTYLKTKHYMNVQLIPMNQINNWKRDRFNIYHEDRTFFKVIGVSISTQNREVHDWSQPLIEQVESGIIGFLVKKINNVLHFLIQAKVEPGSFDILEMAPTVQCITGSYRDEKSENRPHYLDLFLNPPPSNIRYHAFQSEEGGRFYQEQNEYLLLEVGEDFPVEVPENYIWMTLGQITEFIKYNNCLNVQARSLVSCLSFI